MREHRRHRRPRQTNVWLGLILLTIGFVLLFDRMDLVFFPHWLFRWPMILIVFGFLIGVKRQFNGIGWLVLMLIGVFYLAEDLTGNHWITREYGLPLGVIILGVFLVFRALSNRNNNATHAEYNRNWQTDDKNIDRSTQIFASDEKTGSTGGSEEYVDLTSIFGSTKRRIFAKNFKGGQTTNIFGGTELDLTQADIEGTITMDLLQVFGGFEIVVPANWEVKSKVTTIFGGVEDNRSGHPAFGTSGKQLILTGTCLFGGVEIKSY